MAIIRLATSVPIRPIPIIPVFPLTSTPVKLFRSQRPAQRAGQGIPASHNHPDLCSAVEIVFCQSV